MLNLHRIFLCFGNKASRDRFVVGWSVGNKFQKSLFPTEAYSCLEVCVYLIKGSGILFQNIVFIYFVNVLCTLIWLTVGEGECVQFVKTYIWYT